MTPSDFEHDSNAVVQQREIDSQAQMQRQSITPSIAAPNTPNESIEESHINIKTYFDRT